MNDLDVKQLREKLGMTQEEFAKIVGVHPRTVQNWESGAKIPESKHVILRNIAVNPQKYYGGGSVEQQNVNGNNINGKNVTVQTDMDKLLNLLNKKEDALARAQSHIDKLLVIIENLTKQ